MPAAGKHYGFVALMGLWVRNGGSVAAAPLAAAVAIAESGGWSGNFSALNSNGTRDIGLWQINSGHGALASYDPNTNAHAAIKISGDGKNWRPWCTAYTDGACGTKGGAFDPTGPSPSGRAFQAARSGGDLKHYTPAQLRRLGVPDRTGSTTSSPGPLSSTGGKAAGCQHSVTLPGFKVAGIGPSSTGTICFDKIIAAGAMAGGTVLILAGVAVVFAGTREGRAATRAASKATAFLPGVGGAVSRAATAPARRRATRTATASRQQAAATTADTRAKAAARTDAAEARRQAAEARTQEAHVQRMAQSRTRHRRAGQAHSQRLAQQRLRARGTSRSFPGPGHEPRPARPRQTAPSADRPPF
jgi:Lysozyme like domain